MDKYGKQKSKRLDYLLYLLLIGIALLAPLISYAGVSLIYPGSLFTSGVSTSPPITWATGNDYALAVNLGFASGYASHDNKASFVLTISGLSGGSITIDKLLNLTASASVMSFKIKISTALSGTLSPTPDSLKLRIWTGATAPTSDGDASVKAVVDFKAAVNTESVAVTQAATTTYFVQLVYAWNTARVDASGSSTVEIQPSSIVTV
jgi:hypothetical protein